MRTEEQRKYAREYMRKWNALHHEKVLADKNVWYAKNKEIINAKKRAEYPQEKNKILAWQKQYRKLNKEKVRGWRKKEYLTHKDKIKARAKKNIYKRRATDVNFRVLGNLRHRVNMALRDNDKSKRTLELLGCTIDEMKKHLESQFKDGMTWENYGNGWYGKGKEQWHVDHIKQCNTFDLSKPEEQEKCFNFINLQPLWATDNLEKAKK